MSKSQPQRHHYSRDASTISGLLERLKEDERKHVSERASLAMSLKKERQHAQRAEREQRRAEEQRDYRIGQVKHLKAALERRDGMITALQDQVRELEVGVAAADAVRRAERTLFSY